MVRKCVVSVKEDWRHPTASGSLSSGTRPKGKSKDPGAEEATKLWPNEGSRKHLEASGTATPGSPPKVRQRTLAQEKCHSCKRKKLLGTWRHPALYRTVPSLKARQRSLALAGWPALGQQRQKDWAQSAVQSRFRALAQSSAPPSSLDRHGKQRKLLPLRLSLLPFPGSFPRPFFLLGSVARTGPSRSSSSEFPSHFYEAFPFPHTGHSHMDPPLIQYPRMLLLVKFGAATTSKRLHWRRAL